MIQQYKWLLIALLLALLGIIYLQASYTFNNFQMKTDSFEGEVNEIFSQSVAQEKDQRKSEVLSWFRSVLSDTSQIQITVKFDSTKNQPRIDIMDVGDSSPYTSIIFNDDQRKINKLDSLNYQLTVDRITRAAGDYLDENAIYYWTQILGKKLIQKTDSLTTDLNSLEAIFQSKLDSLSISSNFVVKSIPFDSIPPDIDQRSLRTTILNSDLNTTQIDVYAELDNPFLAILKRAWLSILGSLGIIILTATCFYIMLKIIYRQKQLSEIKDDFIDNMTHELQTPIATLMAANEGMQKYNLLEDKEKTEQYLAISKEQIHRLAKMVDQALHNSIYDRKRLIVEPKPCDLKKILKESIHAIETKYGKQHIQLLVEADIDEVVLDPHHFKNVIGNLLDNALKHNQGKEDLRIEVLARHNRHDQVLSLNISDNGKGIPKHHAKNIFDKFYRVDDSEANGYGIGLFYVHQIIQKMGGSIKLDTQTSNGCNFMIEIPQKTNEEV